MRHFFTGRIRLILALAVILAVVLEFTGRQRDGTRLPGRKADTSDEPATEQRERA